MQAHPLVIVVLAILAGGATFGAVLPAPALAELRTELRRAVEEGKTVGAIHLVVSHGETLYLDSAGHDDPSGATPLRADSIVRIYSMTKPLTSVVAMMLHELGKFDLDDPVAKFIPAFAHATVLEKTGGEVQRVSPHRPLTVRDVFRHTTGYSYGDQANVRAFYVGEGMHYWGPGGMFPPKMKLAEAAEALARIPALHHPGERFTYGFSTDLLARLIEVWSGEPLDRFMSRVLLGPLEMVDTGFSVPPEKRSRFTACHTLRDGRLAVLDPAASSPFNDGFEFLSGGGGLVSTVRDYANFCQMLVDGGEFKGRRVLRGETLGQMFTDQLNGIAGPFKFGLGFAIAEIQFGAGALHRTAVEYSWAGYASTDFRIVPAERFFQIFARQQVPSAHQLAARQFLRVSAGVNLAAP